MAAVSAVFEAMFYGICADEDCEQTIAPGDRVMYNEVNKVVHYKCPKVVEPVLCKICNMIKPCWCE